MIQNIPILRFILSLALSALFAAPSYAESALSEQDQELVRQGEQILENNRGGDISGFMPDMSDEIYQLAEEIVSDGMSKVYEGLDGAQDALGHSQDQRMRAEPKTGRWVEVLVSREMGEEALRATAVTVAQSGIEARLVFRGIPEGKKINDAIAEYALLVSELDLTPESTIDPTIFTEHNVQRVPTMIYMDEGVALATVSGLVDPQWLIDQVEDGKRDHLGTRGPTTEISEPNLIEVMQSRMAGIDFEEQKRTTVASYWERADFYPTRPAEETITRELDPSIYLAEPLKGASGEILVAAGTVINPLDLRPFTQTLITFDPSRKAEVQWLSEYVETVTTPITLIASQLDRTNGWDQLEETQDLLNLPVYILTKDVWERFDLRKTPSVVVSSGNRFLIKEFNVDQKAINHE